MMKPTPLEMSLLYDFYGDVLTEKQKNIFDLHYNEDLSLAEISELCGITRQGVRDAIIRSEHTLRDLESKIHLVGKYGNIQKQLQDVQNCAKRIRMENNLKSKSPVIADALDQIDKIIIPLTED